VRESASLLAVSFEDDDEHDVSAEALAKVEDE